MPSRKQVVGGIPPAPEALGETPEADDLVQAEARAAAARARATRLRERADAAERRDPDPAAPAQPTDSVEVVDYPEPAPAARRGRLSRFRPRLHRPRRPSRKTLAMTAAVVFSCATLALSGFLAWHHHNVGKQERRDEEFAAAARRGVVAMMSLDPGKAREEMQRFADDTTGVFKAGILMGAEDAVTAIEKSGVSSTGTVQSVAVESRTNDSAIVLVAAKAEFNKPGQPKPQTQSVRLVVSMLRDNGQIKISRIEFVP